MEHSSSEKSASLSVNPELDKFPNHQVHSEKYDENSSTAAIDTELTNKNEYNGDNNNFNKMGNHKFNLHMPRFNSFKQTFIPKPQEAHHHGYKQDDHTLLRPGESDEEDEEVGNASRRNSFFDFKLRAHRSSTIMDDAQKITYSLGERIRSVIYKLEDIFDPIVKKFIPNFIVAHYVYIIFWVILGSIVIYPQKNMNYVDALMFATGASTQGGLTTLQINDMKLYQQIALYVICMFTTPIFIHGSLTFLRLYWYEKRFDNIKKKSIEQYKMRRTATIANLRTETMRGQTVTGASINGYTHNASEGLSSRMKKFENKQKMKSNSSMDDTTLNNRVMHDVGNNDHNSTTPSRLRFENVKFQNEHDQNRNDNDYFSYKPIHDDDISPVDHISEPSDDENNSVAEYGLHYAHDTSNRGSDISDSNDETGNHNRPQEVRRNNEKSLKIRESKSNYDNDSNSDQEHENDEDEDEDLDEDEDGEEGGKTDEEEHGHLDSDVSHRHPFKEPMNINNAVNSPNITFGELPKPTKKKRDLDPRDLYMSISVLQNNPKKNEDIESGPALRIKSPRELEEEKLKMKRRLPGQRLKHRKLLKKKRLKKLQERGKKMVETEKKLINKELEELKEEEWGLPETPASPMSFNFPTRPRSTKTQRSQSVFFENGIQNTAHSSSDSSGLKDDSLENANNDTSANDVKTDEKARDAQPSFSKRIFANFDNAANSAHDDGESNSDGIRKPSFFSRTMTGFSRRRTMTEPSDLLGNELIEEYAPNMPTNYLSWNPTVGRNSKFITLSNSQKYELGGVEYQAMRLLCKLLIFYYFGIHLIAIIFFVPFADTKQNVKSQLREVGISPTWWAFFNSMSSFNDLGYTLNPTSMMLFAQNAFVLIVSGFLIVIGNTGFPIFLRMIIWVLRLFTRPLTMLHDSLSFLLDHPRRCFTLLFPSGATWWLTAVLVFLNGFDWILFIILDFGTSELSYLPKGYQVLAGLYQSLSTRTAGFNVVDLSTLHPAIQVSYMVMMYISVLPLAISIRRTNVYEEQSLGVYERDEDHNADSTPKLKYIGTHLRKQLSFDLWFLFLAIFIICIAESGKIRNDDLSFGVFQVMFEVTSAYGTVGLSLGYPGSNASFCGQFSTISKLVIIATLIRGRHRGLPNSIDRAIMLSENTLNLRDDLEAYHAMRRNATVGATITTDGINSMFPNISRAATRASRASRSGASGMADFHNEPTISENLKNGVIPFKDIAKTTLKTLGKVATNAFTVTGIPVDKYSRQLTQYTTYDHFGQPYSTSGTMYSGMYGDNENYDDDEEDEGNNYDENDDDDDDDDDEDQGSNGKGYGYTGSRRSRRYSSYGPGYGRGSGRGSLRRSSHSSRGSRYGYGYGHGRTNSRQSNIYSQRRETEYSKDDYNDDNESIPLYNVNNERDQEIEGEKYLHTKFIEHLSEGRHLHVSRSPKNNDDVAADDGDNSGNRIQEGSSNSGNRVNNNYDH